MTDEKLLEHAQRLYDLACGQGSSRHDLIQLRDLVPEILDRLRVQIAITGDLVMIPEIRLEDVGHFLAQRGIEPLTIPTAV